MLPAVTAIQAPIPPAPIIVATALPGNSATLRAPADNVPPTVSNVQVDNHSRSNGGNVSALPARADAAVSDPRFSSFIPSFDGTPTTLSFSAQTTFLAQLLSQDLSPQAKAVLGEYEKLVQIAQVKYKPSNATLPQPEPANLFGRIMQQEKLAQSSSARNATLQAAATAPAAQTLAASAAKPAPQPSRQARTAAELSAHAQPESTPVKLDNTPVAPVRAVSAYQSTVSRNELVGKPSVESA